MRTGVILGSLAVFLLSAVQLTLAQAVTLGANCAVSFASVEAGRAVLTNRDDFVASLSPFDRAARLKTDRVVSEAEFLGFVERSVRAWAAEERSQVSLGLRAAAGKVAPWNLPWPPGILLIKTSGAEEANACYTRQSAIILPAREVRRSGQDMERVLLHELFHVLSRQNPRLKEELYHIIGFRPTNPIEYPPELRDRKLTNPDGVQNGWVIRVTSQDEPVFVAPALFASSDRYDPARGGEFFDYLVFKLLVVARSRDRWQPRLEAGRAQLIDPQEVKGFFEQVGRNTGYLIHPDEILADNFVRLATGDTNLATPRIVAEMKQVFAHPSPGAMRPAPQGMVPERRR